MSLESFLPSFSDLGSTSLLVLEVAVLLYFFGKLIVDTKNRPNEKEDYYIHGLFFSIIYITIPFFLVALTVKVLKFTTSFPIWLSIIVEVVVLVILDLTLVYRVNEVSWKKLSNVTHETIEKTLKNQTEKGKKTESPMVKEAYERIETSENFISGLYDAVYKFPKKPVNTLEARGVRFLFFQSCFNGAFIQHFFIKTLLLLCQF